MTQFIDLPGWIYWWLSTCVSPATADVPVWPPAAVDTFVSVGTWLVPLLCLVSANAAIGLALMSWARKAPRRAIYWGLGAGAVFFAVFIGQFYHVVSDTPTPIDAPAWGSHYYLFVGSSVRNALICGAVLGVSALMLRVLHSRLWQGAFLCLALVQSILLTASWGTFAYATTCGL